MTGTLRFDGGVVESVAPLGLDDAPLGLDAEQPKKLWYIGAGRRTYPRLGGNLVSVWECFADAQANLTVKMFDLGASVIETSFERLRDEALISVGIRVVDVDLNEITRRCWA